jgi:starvation-inducible DNA-binding protein
MVKNLVKGHEQVVKTARDLFAVADEASDEVTADLMVQRMQASEKTAWMLRSLVE